MSELRKLKVSYERQVLSLPWETGHPIGLYVEALEAELASLRAKLRATTPAWGASEEDVQLESPMIGKFGEGKDE